MGLGSLLVEFNYIERSIETLGFWNFGMPKQFIIVVNCKHNSNSTFSMMVFITFSSDYPSRKTLNSSDKPVRYEFLFLAFCYGLAHMKISGLLIKGAVVHLLGMVC